ncbi:MAG: ABC transporter ATP-binding protein, partial [Gammaproteobacteria bacterium]|nr:ABC transporter ATP-binding protein [Gammaproteobacteria bacterium]
KVADLVELTSQLYCRIGLTRPEDAFANAISDWGFKDAKEKLVWEGVVAGPDRLRFLGVLSRYAGLIASIQMDENEVVHSV